MIQAGSEDSFGNKLFQATAWLLATLVFFAAAITYYWSLNHPVSADLAMLHYSAWLINEKSFSLYRDIFELNFPGPFYFHSLFARWFGYEALALHIANGVMLFTLGIITWKILAPISSAAAILSTSLFSLLYMVNGGEYILEREFLCLLPAAASVWFSLSIATPWKMKIVLAAMFAALACSMKPNAVVLVPAIAWILITQCQASHQSKLSMLRIFFCVMLVTASIPFFWANQYGSLPDFIQIYKTFVPIYASSRYDLYHFSSQDEQLQNLIENYLKWGGGALLLSSTGLGWAWSTSGGNQLVRSRIIQLTGITFAFTFYEVLAGKFWTNHMFPSAYWTILCMSLILTAPKKSGTAWRYLAFIFLVIPVGIISYLLSVYSPQQMHTVHQRELRDGDSWRARQIANFLTSENIQPHDTVQVLDMAGDGQASLLMARATSATRHLIDVPLYMEPHSIHTQALRAEFILHLNDKKPRFIVYVEQFLHPGGGNRLREFKPLTALIDTEYEIAEQREGEYIIFRRKSTTAHH